MLAVILGDIANFENCNYKTTTNMKNIEQIKFVCGLTLLSFAIIGGLVVYLESFKILESLLNYNKLSGIFGGGWIYNKSGGGASNTPIFLGLCGLSGAYLLANTKETSKSLDDTNKSEKK